MLRTTPLYLGTILALASAGVHAATYSYTPVNSTTDLWSAGTDWTDGVTTPFVPVSGIDTALVFGPVSNFPDGAILTNVNTNDNASPFVLNSMTLQGIGTITAAFPTSVTIAGGTLNFANSSAAVGPTLNLAATNGGSGLSYTVSSALSLSNDLTISGNGNATFTLSGVISGNANLIKTGTSAVTLSGVNTYTGATSINGGIVKINGAGSLGDNSQATNTINLNGGALESTGGTFDLGVNRTITLNGAGTITSDAGVLTVSGAVNLGANLLTVNGAGGSAISGIIGGTGGLTKTGAGTLTLLNTNTYTGTTTINGGILNLGASHSLGGQGNITFSGGTLQYSASDTADKSIRIVNSTTVGQAIKIDTNGQSITFANPLAASNTTGLTVSSTAAGGVLTLNVANLYTGTTTVTSGTLKLGNTLALGALTNGLTLNGGTLDLATDTSVGAYNTLLTANSTIASDTATAASPGITHTLGNLSISNQTLTTTAGANVLGGTPTIAFASTTVTAQSPTFAPTTAVLQLGNVTGTNTSIVLGGTNTGNNTIGAIAIGTGGVSKNTGSTWTFTQTGTYTGGTTLSGAGSTTIVAADNPFGTVGTLDFNANAPTLQGNGIAHIIGNPTKITSSNSVIGGGLGSDLTFNGSVTNNINGSGNLIVNNLGTTTFHGGVVLSSSTGGRTLTVLGNSGAGNLIIDSAITPNAAGSAAQILDYRARDGTLVLTGAGGAGGTGAGGGSVSIGIGSGVAFTPTSGNSTLNIKGNYTITGNSQTSGNTTVPLIIRGGDGTTTGQGTLSLVDKAINTLTINNAGTGLTGLTIATASKSALNMEIGNNSSDQIILGAGLKVNVGGGGVNLNVNGIGGFTSGAASQALTLLTAPGGGLTANGTNFALTTSGNFGGYTTAVLNDPTTPSTTTALVLTLGGLTATPTTAYFKGTQSGVWNVLTGGIANNSNWTSDVAGTTDTKQIPGATTNVIFTTTGGGANQTTTLGADTTINSLTFSDDAGVAAPVTITGNTLTIAAGTSGGNTAGNGISVSGASGAHTINSNVALGAAQTWTVGNDPANALTVNGVVSGAFGLTKDGGGTLVLGGSNTLTGGLTIANGILRINNVGALNSTTPQALTFAASAPSTAKFQVNGINATIGALSTNAIPGTPIVENASATAATLSITQSTNSTFAGVLQDGVGGGSLGLAKRGTGTLDLAGVNTYTGATTVGNGHLLIDGSLAAGSAVNITANADNRTAVLGGIGTINGAVTVTAPIGTGRLNEITAADIGTTGTLTLTSGLTIGAGGVAYFDINTPTDRDFIDITAGGLNITSGAQVRVTPNLAAGTYDLISFTGAAPSLGSYALKNLDGTDASGSYELAYTGVGGNVLSLVITGSATAVPSISISTPITGTRVMKNTANVPIAGIVGNANGGTQLVGQLADNGGQLTVGSFGTNPVNVAALSTAPYTAAVLNTGTTLGVQTFKISVTDQNATPTTASATGTLDVLDNRVVSASSVNFGAVHVNTAVTAPTNLTTTGTNDQYTAVTVANAGADANGIAISGGTAGTVFNGPTVTDARTAGGTFTTIGPKAGPITLLTTGEGNLPGEAPINVPVNYTASVFSGKAAWNNSGATSPWVTQANWGDTQTGDLGGIGAPGLDGVASIGDTATFGDVAGAGAATTVTLDGVSPSLAGITFNSTNTSYTLSTGTGGVITLQGVATPVDVTGSHTIGTVLAGTGGGLRKTGTGTLTLTGANTYTGATSVNNGTLVLDSGDNRLPVTTGLTLGDATANTSGKLILGGATNRNQTLAGLFAAGTGIANSIVGGSALATNSILTVNYAGVTSDTFSGNIGGAGVNENNLALVKSGTGTLILSGSNTYTGITTLTAGTLQAGSLGALGGNGPITFGGGTLQFSAASAPNANNYLSRFTGGNNLNYSIDTNNVTVAMDDSTVGSPFNAATGQLTKLGAGTLVLSNISTYALPSTTISNGALQTPSGSDFAASYLRLAGTINGNITSYAVWQTQGTVTKTLAGNGVGNLIWNSWSGFAAQGGPLSVSLASVTPTSGGIAIPNAPLSWGTNSFIAAGTAPMAFGSSTADNAVTLQNSFDFGAATANLSIGFNRVIDVEGARATIGGVGADAYGLSGNHAVLAGAVTANQPYIPAVVGPPAVGAMGDLGNNGFTKTGPGTLVLAGQNTYSGATIISGGTLVAGTNALLGVPGAFGDGHQVVSTVTTNGTQAITLGAANVNGLDGTTAMGASPTLLIGGAYTVALPITIGNFATTGTYRIGGSTANSSTISGLITTSQSFTISQVAGGTLNLTGADSNGSGSINSLVGGLTATFTGAGNIDVSGTITGGGIGLTVLKSGTGILTLSSQNAYTGGTSITAGTLVATDPLALSSGSVFLTGGALALGGSSPLTLNADDFNWGSGGTIELDLGSDGVTSDTIQANSFNLISGTNFVFDFNGSGVGGGTYTLANFSSTTFVDPSVFSVIDLAPGVTGTVQLSGNTLTLMTVPEPTTVSLWLASAAFFVIGGRRRIKAFLRKG